MFQDDKDYISTVPGSVLLILNTMGVAEETIGYSSLTWKIFSDWLARLNSIINRINLEADLNICTVLETDGKT